MRMFRGKGLGKSYENLRLDMEIYGRNDRICKIEK